MEAFPLPTSNTIVLRFVKYSTITSDAIEVFQRDDEMPTHVECVTSKGTWLGSQGPDGVIDRPANYDSAKTIVWQKFIVVQATPAQVEAFYCFMHAQEGKPYDYEGIVHLVLGTREWRAGKKWFCSELVAAALEYAGFWKLVAECTYLDPRDVYLILSGRINIEGNK